MRALTTGTADSTGHAIPACPGIAERVTPCDSAGEESRQPVGIPRADSGTMDGRVPGRSTVPGTAVD